MREEKYNLVLDEQEQGVMINALNDMRNRLMEENRTTDIVDDVLLKTAKARKRKFGSFRRESHEQR